MNVLSAVRSRLQITSPILGTLIWVILVVTLRPSPMATRWAELVLLLAALVLVPLALILIPSRDARQQRLVSVLIWTMPPAAWLLTVSFFWPVGMIAGTLSLPWLFVTGLVALYGIVRMLDQHRILGEEEASTPCSVSESCTNMGLVYLIVGGGWTALARLGMRPLEFDAVIVLLTGIHFHYAGFLLPILMGAAGTVLANGAARLTCVLVIVAVPLVAVGITMSQLGFSPMWECFAACFMAVAGMLVAWLHLRLALQRRWPTMVRVCWAVAGASLLFGMVFAFLYGSRSWLALPWLDIPWMRALHGTTNAVGFGIVGVIGWQLHRRLGESLRMK